VDVAKSVAVDALRRSGHPEAADLVAREMPDPIDVNELLHAMEPFGIGSINDLIMRMGGSP
jgi:hypothetical protein